MPCAYSKAAGLNVSALTQEALRSALAVERVNSWLGEVTALRPLEIEHDDVVAAVSAARAELEGDG